MKLKDSDIRAFNEFFEEALNRAQRVDRHQKIQIRRKLRNELFSMLGWELATPAGIMSRWEERLSEVFAVLPFGFKDDLNQMLVERLRSPLLGKGKKDGRDQLHAKKKQS
jgi:hypothetical protein